MKSDQVIAQRKKEAIVLANKLVLYLTRTGIPTEFGFVKTISGHEFEYNAILSTVSVEVGGVKQLFVNVDTKNVTVFRGKTWLTFLDKIDEVLEREVSDNPAFHKLEKYFDI